MSSERYVPIQGRLSEAERRRFQVMCLENGLVQADAIGEAVREWMKAQKAARRGVKHG